MKINAFRRLGLAFLAAGILNGATLLSQCCYCYCWVSPNAGDHCVYTGEPALSECKLVALGGNEYCAWGNACFLAY